ncbi:MAG: cation transporter [Erysipelotrichaceae bacterium]|nr:cation transporter [Erysipelotrichaceae bacterium]
MNVELREKEITKTSIIGIVVNILLASFKALVGVLSGAISIVLDAINNLTDAISSIVTIIGINLAKKKPDVKHPFGHGRIEYISAIIISLIVLGAGISSLYESVKSAIHPEMPDYTPVTIIVVVTAVVTKFILGSYVKKQGEKFKSGALIASGSDASFDALITASTLLGAIAARLFNISIDGLLGIIISVFIIKAGVEMMQDSLGSIIGVRFDDVVSLEIKDYINSFDGVIGTYDLVVHNYGPSYALGSVHIEVPSDMTAYEIYKLTSAIQKGVLSKYSIYFTISIYAVDESHVNDSIKIQKIAHSHDGVIECHGIFFDDIEKQITFDIVVDFIVDQKELKKTVTEEVMKEFKDYSVSVNIDLYYSN